MATRYLLADLSFFTFCLLSKRLEEAGVEGVVGGLDVGVVGVVGVVVAAAKSCGMVGASFSASAWNDSKTPRGLSSAFAVLDLDEEGGLDSALW